MANEKLSRLLHLYPVEVLRIAWDLKGVKAEIVTQVAKDASRDEIEGFCRVHQGRTKQRVILLDNLAENFKAFGDPLLGPKMPVFIKRTSQRLEEFYLLDVSYTAIVGPPYTEQRVDFLWPVSVTVDAATVQLTFTMMEKNIGTYLGAQVNAYGVKKDLDEDGVIALLAGALDDPSMVKRADINKGVKELWEAGTIDAAHSRWKASKATLTETMDEKCFLKKDDHNAYQRAMKAPLLKTVLHTMDLEKKFPPVFTVVPCDGELAVTRYPDTPEEVANVVGAILSLN